jgi:hypothetical protein
MRLAMKAPPLVQIFLGAIGRWKDFRRQARPRFSSDYQSEDRAFKHADFAM